MTGKSLRRVLIANRGEIAVRIIRACRELGLETVQVYAEPDRQSLPVRLADRAICIGPARAAESYLNATAILSAALTQGADAIHPGYGFLSEQPAFARQCELAGITFIGPAAQVIEQMGDKAAARRLAAAAGMSITPGSEGIVTSHEAAAAVARDLGYPVLLKAAAGGGGRGMRVVRKARQLAAQFARAAGEAEAAFGSSALYVEKYLTAIRHVEIQVLSDGDTVLHLGERDCSVQRRHQKLLEESPAPGLSAALRARLGAAAVQLCRHVGYTNAGTVEYILDEETRQFYFMEMNTRLQVEHPVTELVTGIDIVKAQILIAQGQPLGIRQEDIVWRGHAIECRINAEDPERGFLPRPGRVERFHSPGGPGIRVDSHLCSGDVIPPYYDSLLAKMIAWGRDREEALARMQRALSEMEVTGVHTTIPFHLRLLCDRRFREGRVHTRFVEDVLLEGL